MELFEAYRGVERFRRETKMSIEQYIMEFKSRILKAEKLGMNYPAVIQSFKLLEGSKTSEIEK